MEQDYKKAKSLKSENKSSKINRKNAEKMKRKVSRNKKSLRRAHETSRQAKKKNVRYKMFTSDKKREIDHNNSFAEVKTNIFG